MDEPQRDLRQQGAVYESKLINHLEQIIEEEDEKDEAGSYWSFSSLSAHEGSQHDDISYYTDHKL